MRIEADRLRVLLVDGELTDSIMADSVFQKVNVGILGATGAVGQEMIKILEERNFPVASLRPIASARSAGSRDERSDTS